MSLGDILFNPNGRLGPGNFWRGYIILLAANIVTQVISYMAGPTNQAVALLIFVVWLVLLWCTFVVFAKRLHDTGASAGWVLLVALGWSVVVLVARTVIYVVFAGEEFSLAMQDPDYAASPQFLAEVVTKTFVPTTAVVLAISIALGFILAGLRSDPNDNQYGQASRSQSGGTFE